MLNRKMNSQHGMATIEIIPILAIFILLVNFSLGFFGIIHSGLLQSIAARNYAFETFRNRSNLNLIRDFASEYNKSSDYIAYETKGYRYHGIKSELNQSDEFPVTRRPLKFSDSTNSLTSNLSKRTVSAIDDNKKVSEAAGFEGREEGVNTVWIRIRYGICLNSACGDGT